MEKIYKESIGLWQLRTDKSHILHRIGSDDYTEMRDAHVSKNHKKQMKKKKKKH